MIQKNIIVQKTARYFTLGNFTEQTENVWMVCHGYGQLANYFLKKFKPLDDGKNVIISPEALHRFYRNGFSGHVGASWMTKEERTDEIKDYIQYLEQIYQEAIIPNLNPKTKITILGFSQATATVCRWLESKQPKINHLILWGGLYPHDLNISLSKSYFNQLTSYLLIGDQDEYFTKEDIEKHQKEIQSEGLITKVRIYPGNHDISQEELSKISEILINKSLMI